MFVHDQPTIAGWSKAQSRAKPHIDCCPGFLLAFYMTERSRNAALPLRRNGLTTSKVTMSSAAAAMNRQKWHTRARVLIFYWTASGFNEDAPLRYTSVGQFHVGLKPPPDEKQRDAYCESQYAEEWMSSHMTTSNMGLRSE